jgi:hypothetical protein
MTEGAWLAATVLLSALLVGMAVAVGVAISAPAAAWSAHKAALAPDIAAADAIVAQLQTMVGAAGVVTLKGSMRTRSAQAASDIDVRIRTPSCDAYDTVVAVLQASGQYQHVHSGGRFALFAGSSPLTTRPVDVSVTVKARPPKPRLPGMDDLRGFMEFILRRNHPGMTLRAQDTKVRPTRVLSSG